MTETSFLRAGAGSSQSTKPCFAIFRSCVARSLCNFVNDALYASLVLQEGLIIDRLRCWGWYAEGNKISAMVNIHKYVAKRAQWQLVSRIDEQRCSFIGL